MRTFLAAILMTILSGCNPVASGDAWRIALGPRMDAHAVALTTDDLSAIRATGRDLIATYDALVGAQ